MLPAILVAVLLSQAEPHDRRVREYRRAGDRGPGVSRALFEAFNGAGTTTACSTTSPTGAKGEVLTFTRASAATCTKTASGGLATTGIADGDLVSLSTNVARVEYDSNGVLGLLVEAAATNLLLRNIEYANAAWADVGTPTLTGSQTDPFGATNAVQFDDNNAAAYEGRSQSVTVSAGAAHFMHCYVKAGTLAEARILLDGTAATITGLSATTWSIIQVADASSSGVSISAQVMNGDATTDTGTVIWGGCQVETGTYRHSIIPTTSAAVTRAADGPITASGVALAGLTSTGSAAVSMTPAGATAPSLTGGILLMNGAGRPLYFNSSNQLDIYDGVTDVSIAGGAVAGVTKRYWTSWSGSTLTATNATDGTASTGAFDGTMDTTGPLGVCHSATIGSFGSYICSRVCLDPSSTRCR